VGLFLAGVRPFDPTPAEAITVDIVAPDEVPSPASNFELPKPETPAPDRPSLSEKETVQPPAQKPAQQSKKAVQVAASTPAPAKQSPATQPPAAEQKPVEQPPPQAASIPYADISQQFAKLAAESTGDFDAPAAAAANISTESAKALRDHLKTCSILPKSVSRNDQVKIVLRVAFLRDGKLAREPLLIEASASDKGPALMQSAIDALLACQPYSVLPAEKYEEWRMLDLSFTPKDFRG
jgi:hypothetical protein